MKYYSLYTLLMWIQHEVNTEFEAAIKIYNAIADPNLSDDESREIVFDTLRKSGMKEEGFEEQPAPKYEDDKKDIVQPEGTHQTIVVLEEFEIRMHDRLYKIAIYLN